MTQAEKDLAQVLKDAIYREEQRIERAQAEIRKLNTELSELGVELPLHETYATWEEIPKELRDKCLCSRSWRALDVEDHTAHCPLNRFQRM